MRQDKSPLFQQRHYEWLAHFAGYHLNSAQWQILAFKLAEDNSRFKYDRFIRAVEKATVQGSTPTT